MEKINDKLHKFIKLVSVVVLLWAHPLKSDVPHYILAQMAEVSYNLHRAPKALPTWQAIAIEDSDYTYGAIFYKATSPRDTVVVFRGTFVTDDWLTNVQFNMVPCDVCSGNHQIYFHEGYYSRAQQMLPLLLAAMKQIPTNSQPSLSFVGHSKGGAVASILSVLYADKKKINSLGLLVTFGAPQSGNINAVLRLDKLFDNRQTHYGLVGDIVPVTTALAGLLMMTFNEDDGDVQTYAPYSYQVALPSISQAKDKKRGKGSESNVAALKAIIGAIPHAMHEYREGLAQRR
ncbi:MAG: hypothetical protein J0G29_01455 [Alphaproteobacteria bacterium]|nr:hypothetical protein [Alphaproteobacteria bacterium]OJV47541.1 MAG: hypothetical protein BGO28_06815 [Alphaproteobacteria bacterium 43-37]